MTRGDRDRAMILQDEVSEMSGHISSFSWSLGEHRGWSWRLWDLYLAFLPFLETQEDYTSQPSQSGGTIWQFLTKEICVGECFLSPWKPLLGSSSPTLESQYSSSPELTQCLLLLNKKEAFCCVFSLLEFCECVEASKNAGGRGREGET